MIQAMEPFHATRLGVLMEPDPNDPREAGGVLNPALARGRDGQLYLFPRLVAAGNYSRIGIARVVLDAHGDPVGVERLGLALEPVESYEKNSETGGGVEDPRITFVEPLDCYLMTYTAFSEAGPRIALASSRDLFHWERLGLVQFTRLGDIDFGAVNNKDAVIFPEFVHDPEGRPSLGLIHRPLFPGTKPTDAMAQQRIHHESLWISYCAAADLLELGHWEFGQHHRLLSPRASWERIKVGAGAPPILTRLGWLLVYHGVGGSLQHRHFHYSAGAAVLDARNPCRVVYRSPHPILAPGPQEHSGVVPDVVFPTGLDRRTDIGQPSRFDMYFGMADDRIGVASFRIPRSLTLPAGEDEHRAA